MQKVWCRGKAYLQHALHSYYSLFFLPPFYTFATLCIREPAKMFIGQKMWSLKSFKYCLVELQLIFNVGQCVTITASPKQFSLISLNSLIVLIDFRCRIVCHCSDFTASQIVLIVGKNFKRHYQEFQETLPRFTINTRKLCKFGATLIINNVLQCTTHYNIHCHCKYTYIYVGGP